MSSTGDHLVRADLTQGPLGPYRLQAAIQAVHTEAPTAEATDWPQVLALYRLLDHVAPGPVVTLNRAVAVAEVDGPGAGLALVDAMDAEARGAVGHRFHSTRAHLLEKAGSPDEALAAFREAARRTTNLVERRYLLGRAAALDAGRRGTDERR